MNNKKVQSVIYWVWDLCTALSVWIIFKSLAYNFYGTKIFYGLSAGSSYVDLFLPLLWTILYAFAGFYNDVLQKSRIKEFFLFLFISAIGVILAFFSFMLNNQWTIDGYSVYRILFLYLSLQCGLGVLVKMLVMSYSKYQIRKKKIFYNTLLIGANQRAKIIYDEIKTKSPYLGLHFMAYLHVGAQDSNFMQSEIKNIGTIENLDKIVRRCKVEQVIIAVEPSQHEIITEILTKLEGLDIKISIIPDLYQMLIGSVRISHVLGLPLIEIKQELMPEWQIVVKRIIDVSVSLLVLVLCFPLFLVIAVITNFSSEGGIFYRQVRMGRFGKPFRIFKFRSMVKGAENQGYALSKDNDPRVTKWGKFMRKTRLDEIPQFYNVLIGDMSLVGPRPERQYFIEQIIQVAPHYRHLQKVRPGITSLGQVKFGYAENVDQMVQRLQYDIIYIENMSLLMDFRILIYTIQIVLSAKGK